MNSLYYLIVRLTGNGDGNVRARWEIPRWNWSEAVNKICRGYFSRTTSGLRARQSGDSVWTRVWSNWLNEFTLTGVLGFHSDFYRSELSPYPRPSSSSLCLLRELGMNHFSDVIPSKLDKMYRLTSTTTSSILVPTFAPVKLISIVQRVLGGPVNLCSAGECSLYNGVP